jgi:hypothetical protein
LSCTDSLISQAVAHAASLTKQGVPRSRALKHASQRFGFTTKQIMSASGRARLVLDPFREIAQIGVEFHCDTLATVGEAGNIPAFTEA